MLLPPISTQTISCFSTPALFSVLYITSYQLPLECLVSCHNVLLIVSQFSLLIRSQPVHPQLIIVSPDIPLPIPIHLQAFSSALWSRTTKNRDILGHLLVYSHVCFTCAFNCAHSFARSLAYSLQRSWLCRWLNALFNNSVLISSHLYPHAPPPFICPPPPSFLPRKTTLMQEAWWRKAKGKFDVYQLKNLRCSCLCFGLMIRETPIIFMPGFFFFL